MENYFMKIKKILLPLALILFADSAIAADYSWAFGGGGQSYPTPRELCEASGQEVRYPIKPKGDGWYGFWGHCNDTIAARGFFRYGDGCPVGTMYVVELGECQNLDDPPRNPSVAEDPKPDECPDGNIDVTGHCQPETDPEDCEEPVVGNPILVSTGQKVQYEKDISIEGSALSFERNYWSSRRSVSNVGLGWQFNWRMHIQQLTYRNKIKLYRSNGSGIIFEPTSDGQWKGPLGTEILLITLSNDNGWKVVTANGDVEIYNSLGQLISYSKNGNSTIEFYYNAVGQLTTLVEHGTNRILTITYNNKGLITNVAINTGLSVTFNYDSKNRLISRVKNAKTKKYHYENSQYPSALTGITDERDIRYATWTYNEKGQAISSENAGGTNKYQLEFLDNNRTRVINPLGKSTIYHFKDFLLKRKLMKVEGEATGSCIASNTNYYRNNYQGLLTSKDDKNGGNTAYNYDSRGLEIKRAFYNKKPLYINYTVTTKWHDLFPLPTEITKEGRKTTFKYDENGRLLNKTIHSN